jgi:signal transduction histidine kinase
VIVNLLLNSIQAMEAGQAGDRAIVLKTGVDDNDILTFSIRDTGPGIPADHIDRIFEGFFTTKEGGLGIGLGICQSIILAHGGSITAANHRDGGAEFRFTLPSDGDSGGIAPHD